jgi:hypothetical protein
MWAMRLVQIHNTNVRYEVSVLCSLDEKNGHGKKWTSGWTWPKSEAVFPCLAVCSNTCIIATGRDGALFGWQHHSAEWGTITHTDTWPDGVRSLSPWLQTCINVVKERPFQNYRPRRLRDYSFQAGNTSQKRYFVTFTKDNQLMLFQKQ